MSFFSDLFGGGYQDAAKAEQQALQQGYSQASDLLGKARGAINQYGAAGLAPYTDIFNSASRGATAYGDATGANGPEGYARAISSFRTDPGYQFQLNQGLQAIDRGAASRGMVTSGNTLTAEQQYGTGLADQSYGNYVARLQPYLQQQNVGAAGVAQGNQWQGGNLANTYGTQGNLAYQTQAGIGNAQAAADVAGQNASNSFLQGALGLGSKLLGYSIGGGFNGAPLTGARVAASF